MPKTGRIVERYIASPSSQKESRASRPSEEHAGNPLPKYLALPSLWNGKPTLMETARQMGFLNQSLPMGLTFNNGQTVLSNHDANHYLLQQQRNFLA
jgi:hypothetical protein